jgi:undecaprenyl diphosphate synthase
MQSPRNEKAPLHVAIIMDGNGRWARARALPRTVGHRAGVEAARAVVEAAPKLGVTALTLFAFSSDNWRRPPLEVSALMALLRQYLRSDLEQLVERGARLTVIGRRDRLPAGLSEEIGAAEGASASGTQLHLRIALDYSSRDAIANAAAGWREAPSRDDFSRRLRGPREADAGNVDLLIRSGGEKRLSDFLLWESAYAELCFVDTLWPDFGAAELAAAVADFHHRDRRFGGLSAADRLVAAE